MKNRGSMALRKHREIGLVRKDTEASDMADLLTESRKGAVIRMKIERSLDPLRRVIARLLGDYFRSRLNFFGRNKRRRVVLKLPNR
jgi:TetR/AcrR family transcriptional repressor of nem operon